MKQKFFPDSFKWSKGEMGMCLASIPLMPASLQLMGDTYLSLVNHGINDKTAFIFAFSAMGGVLSFAGMSGYMVGEYGAKAVKDTSVFMMKKAITETKNFFKKHQIKTEERETLFLRDSKLADFLEEAFLNEGTPFKKMQHKEVFAFSSNRVSMEVQVKRLTEMPQYKDLDIVSIAPKGLGDLAPTMILRNSDGAAALWADKNDKPLYTVNFNKEGEVEWIYDYASKSRYIPEEFKEKLPNFKEYLLSAGNQFVTEDEYEQPLKM